MCWRHIFSKELKYTPAFGKHSLDVCSPLRTYPGLTATPLKRIKEVLWTYVLTRHSAYKLRCNWTATAT